MTLLSSGEPPQSSGERPLWIDPRFRHFSARRWRKVHLDFHNSQHVPRIGAGFDPDEFGDRLVAARVNAIVVFAKDMHGYFYYPTELGPVHPGLSFDLLGQQVQACRRRDILVSAYYCVTWDNYLAERHPEWLVFKRDRTTYLPRFDQTPGWTALCLAHADFVDLVLAQSRELLARYDLDGIWYDMPLPIDGECFCATCLEQLRDAGRDPFRVEVQRAHKQELLVGFQRQAYRLAREIRPGCQVEHNNQTRLGLGERAPFLDNVDIESLPTASWGYLYFPTNVRYARQFGRSVCGQTGRFHRSWGDFGGLKHPTQLRTEVAGIVAQAAQCCIGDQLPPSGRLDPVVYETIGRVYAEIERLGPYLGGAAPVVEAAIVVAGLPLDDVGQTAERDPSALGESVLGTVKLLAEHHVQFDVVEVGTADLDRYRLLVLPDDLAIDDRLAHQLAAYLEGGGALIAGHNALRRAGGDASWWPDLGLSYHGESPYAPSYLGLEPSFRGDLPDYEYALYDGSARWEVVDGGKAETLARLGVPLFQRNAEHYTSHAQTPFSHFTSDVAVARSGRLGAVAFPIGTSYYRHGYWIYREVYGRLLRRLLPRPLVETSAPISAEVTVTHQTAEESHPARWLIHVVNFSPNRRSPAHVEYHEDPIPLREVRVGLALDAPVTRAYLATDRTELPLQRVGDRWQVEIPRVEVGAIAVLE